MPDLTEEDAFMLGTKIATGRAKLDSEREKKADADRAKAEDTAAEIAAAADGVRLQVEALCGRWARFATWDADVRDLFDVCVRLDIPSLAPIRFTLNRHAEKVDQAPRYGYEVAIECVWLDDDGKRQTCVQTWERVMDGSMVFARGREEFDAMPAKVVAAEGEYLLKCKKAAEWEANKAAKKVELTAAGKLLDLLNGLIDERVEALGLTAE